MEDTKTIDKRYENSQGQKRNYEDRIESDAMFKTIYTED